MSTSSHDRPPARAAAARARARRFQNAVLNHTGSLLEAGAEVPGDVERYHMAWLSVHAVDRRCVGRGPSKVSSCSRGDA